MNQERHTAIVKETFDSVSAGYDSEVLRFFRNSAEQMADCLELRGDEQVLDVATGTGHAALEIAKCLPRGRVTGVDISAGMLARARRKAVEMGIENVEFREGDMQSLGFPAGHFDMASCAFGIFFVEDMDAQLLHIASTVKAGGQVAITCFQEDYFHPLKDMMQDRLARNGVAKAPQTWRRIATTAGCRELLAGAGLHDIRVESKNVGYYLDSAEDWWDVIWNAGFRRLVSQLPADALEQFKSEHLREVEKLRTADGIWLDAGVLFAVGTCR